MSDEIILMDNVKLKAFCASTQIITEVNSKWLLGKDAFKFKSLSMGDLPSHTHADWLLCKDCPTMRAGIQHFPVASFWLKRVL